MPCLTGLGDDAYVLLASAITDTAGVVPAWRAVADPTAPTASPRHPVGSSVPLAAVAAAVAVAVLLLLCCPLLGRALLPSLLERLTAKRLKGGYVNARAPKALPSSGVVGGMRGGVRGFEDESVAGSGEVVVAHASSAAIGPSSPSKSLLVAPAGSAAIGASSPSKSPLTGTFSKHGGPKEAAVVRELERIALRERSIRAGGSDSRPVPTSATACASIAPPLSPAAASGRPHWAVGASTASSPSTTCRAAATALCKAERNASQQPNLAQQELPEAPSARSLLPPGLRSLLPAVPDLLHVKHQRAPHQSAAPLTKAALRAMEAAHAEAERAASAMPAEPAAAVVPAAETSHTKIPATAALDATDAAAVLAGVAAPAVARGGRRGLKSAPPRQLARHHRRPRHNGLTVPPLVVPHEAAPSVVATGTEPRADGALSATTDIASFAAVPPALVEQALGGIADTAAGGIAGSGAPAEVPPAPVEQPMGGMTARIERALAAAQAAAKQREEERARQMEPTCTDTGAGSERVAAVACGSRSARPKGRSGRPRPTVTV
jgi:hypothetical protein